MSPREPLNVRLNMMIASSDKRRIEERAAQLSISEADVVRIALRQSFGAAPATSRPNGHRTRTNDPLEARRREAIALRDRLTREQA